MVRQKNREPLWGVQRVALPNKHASEFLRATLATAEVARDAVKDAVQVVEQPVIGLFRHPVVGRVDDEMQLIDARFAQGALDCFETWDVRTIWNVRLIVGDQYDDSARIRAELAQRQHDGIEAAFPVVVSAAAGGNGLHGSPNLRSIASEAATDLRLLRIVGQNVPEEDQSYFNVQVREGIHQAERTLLDAWYFGAHALRRVENEHDLYAPAAFRPLRTPDLTDD